MKIVIIGGTGLIGSQLVQQLQQAGHEVIAASPNTGVNTLTGEGLAAVLQDASVVVDVSNSPSFEATAVMNFFKTSMKNFPVADYDVLKHFDELMNRKLPEIYGTNLTSFAPSVNIQETKEGYQIDAELPGVSREDVEVSMKDDCLVISGEKKSMNEERKDQYHRIERTYGNFYRAIAMPTDIDREKINAELKDGVLRIDIMKAHNTELAAKKITVR